PGGFTQWDFGSQTRWPVLCSGAERPDLSAPSGPGRPPDRLTRRPALTSAAEQHTSPWHDIGGTRGWVVHLLLQDATAVSIWAAPVHGREPQRQNVSLLPDGVLSRMVAKRPCTETTKPSQVTRKAASTVP